jgi:hypothetical protein
VNRLLVRLRPVSFALRLVLIGCLAAVAFPACGKKGPPRPPLVRLPARPADFVVRRLASSAYIQVRIPTTNNDGTGPADVVRVEVYGFTGSPEGNDDILKRGTLVASIPVRKPLPSEDGATAEKGKKRPKGEEKPAIPRPDAKPVPPRPPASMENGFDQGDLIVVSEPIGPEQTTPVPPLKKVKPLPPPPPPEIAPPPGPPPAIVTPTRIYVTLGINHKGQKGPVSGRQQVPLVDPPAAPTKVALDYSENRVTVTWAPPALFRQPIIVGALPDATARPTTPAAAPGGGASSRMSDIERQMGGNAGPPSAGAGRPPGPGGEPPSGAPPAAAQAAAPPAAAPGAAAQAADTTKPAAAAAKGPIEPLRSRFLLLSAPTGAFNVYEVPPARPAGVKLPEAPPPGGVMPTPVNDKPLLAPPLLDRRVQFGADRCYAVRTVTQLGTFAVESDLSEPACIALVDRFAPAAPTGLQAVAGEGAISLIWEANSEADLLGYLVLRAEGTGTPKALMPAPIAETTFRDTTAVKGVRYSYVIVAVDKAKNQSQPSNKVEEVAR